jgi:hypothetical protein
MRVLTAAVADGPDEFSWTVPGELVVLTVPCPAGHACGCTAGFAGLSSRRATSCAQVTDLDISAATLVAMLNDWPESTAMTLAGEVLTIAATYPVGTLLRRDRDRVTAR